MSETEFDIDELLENFHRWLEAQSMEPLAAYAERLTDQVPDSTPWAWCCAWPTTRTACWRKPWPR